MSEGAEPKRRAWTRCATCQGWRYDLGCPACREIENRLAGREPLFASDGYRINTRPEPETPDPFS